jgi:hypothetical protein
MNEHLAMVVFAVALMSIDLVNAFYSVRLSRRIAAMEHVRLGDFGTCATCRATIVTSAESIRALTEIVSRHTEEIAQIRKIGNERQTEILNAIHLIHADVMESIEKRIMPKNVLEAALRDLYNRTEARDPDAPGRLDADIP